MFNDDAARNDKHDVTLAAPVVGEIFGAVIHQANLNLAEVPHARRGCSRFTEIRRGGKLRPIDRPDGEVVELHSGSRILRRLPVAHEIYHRTFAEQRLAGAAESRIMGVHART